MFDLACGAYHQDAAENTFTLTIKPGIAPGSMHFTTTFPSDVTATFRDDYRRAHDPSAILRFKGNIDLNKFQALIDEVGAIRFHILSRSDVNPGGRMPGCHG